MSLEALETSEIRGVNLWFVNSFPPDDTSPSKPPRLTAQSTSPPINVAVQAKNDLNYILCLNANQRQSHLASVGCTGTQALTLFNLQHSWPSYDARISVNRIARECADRNEGLDTMLDRWLGQEETRCLRQRLSEITFDHHHLAISHSTCRAAEMAIEAFREAKAVITNARRAPEPPAQKDGMLPQILHEPDQTIDEQLDRLSTIENGWNGPDSKGPRPEDVNWIRSTLARHWLPDMPTPFVFPMESGGFNMEWYIGNTHHGLEIDCTNRTGFWEFWDRKSDQEHEETLELSQTAAWHKMQTASRGRRPVA